MRDLVTNVSITLLLMLGILSILNIKSVSPRELASIYTDIHGGLQ